MDNTTKETDIQRDETHTREDLPMQKGIISDGVHVKKRQITMMMTSWWKIRKCGGVWESKSNCEETRRWYKFIGLSWIAERNEKRRGRQLWQNKVIFSYPNVDQNFSEKPGRKQIRREDDKCVFPVPVSARLGDQFGWTESRAGHAWRGENREGRQG